MADSYRGAAERLLDPRLQVDQNLELGAAGMAGAQSMMSPTAAVTHGRCWAAWSPHVAAPQGPLYACKDVHCASEFSTSRDSHKLSTL
jgi:hypothetical protein